MASLREVKESPLRQGTDERIGYVFNYTDLIAKLDLSSSDLTTDVSTTTDSFELYDMTNAADVTDTLLSGSGSVSTYYVTTPLVITLTAGVDYKLTSTVVISSNTISAYAIIRGE